MATKSRARACAGKVAGNRLQPVESRRGIWPPPETLLVRIMRAHAHGVKILHHLASMELDRGHYTNVTLSQLKETVALVKDHPALLAVSYNRSTAQAGGERGREQPHSKALETWR